MGGVTGLLPSMTAAQGADLVMAVARQRDKAAYAALYRYYAPRITSYLMKQGATLSEGEEITQETFLTVWSKADQFDPHKAAVSTWLFTIARNKRIDALRRQTHIEVDDADPLLVPEAPADGHDVVDARERQEAVAEALAALPADQATVMRLSFYEDKTHAEIASALNVPLGTIKSRLRLAFKRVRAEIAGRYGSTGNAP